MALTPLPVRNPSLLQVGSAPDVSTVTAATRKMAKASVLVALAAQEPLSLSLPVTAVILCLFFSAVASRTMTE